MKNTFVLFAIGLLSQNVFASSANLYAPTLSSVVAVYDIADAEFSPFLFHAIQGETLSMKMDDSCEHIQVNRQGAVACLNKTHSVIVGQIGKKVSQEGFGVSYSIQWKQNVEILETSTRYGLLYSVRVK